MGVYPATLGPVFPATAGALPWEQGGDARPPGSLSLLSGGTFTRSTEGSYLIGPPTNGDTAFLAWAPSDVRRIEDRGDGLGSMLLMEGSRTNYLLQSRAMGNAAWAAGTATLTNDQNAGPDGAGLADQENATSGQFSQYQVSKGQVAYSTASVWVRAVSGTVSHQILLVQGAAGNHAARAASFGTTWGRNYVSGNCTPGQAGAAPLDARNWTALGGQVATAQNAYLDLAQVETGYFPSSPIRTTAAAVTRGADALSYAAGAYPSSFLTSGFTIVVTPDESSAEVVSNNSDRRIIQVGANDYVRIRKNTNCVVELVCGGVVVATLTVTYSRYQTLAISARPSAGSLTVSGATTGDGTNTGTGAAWASASTLYVGTDNAGTSSFYGRLSTTVTGL